MTQNLQYRFLAIFIFKNPTYHVKNPTHHLCKVRKPTQYSLGSTFSNTCHRNFTHVTLVIKFLDTKIGRSVFGHDRVKGTLILSQFCLVNCMGQRGNRVLGLDDTQIELTF